MSGKSEGEVRYSLQHHVLVRASGSSVQVGEEADLEDVLTVSGARAAPEKKSQWTTSHELQVQDCFSTVAVGTRDTSEHSRA